MLAQWLRGKPRIIKFLNWRQMVLGLLIASLGTGCIPSSRLGLLRPNGVAVAPDGSLYIMDRGHYRIVHLSTAGEFLGAFGQLGTGPEDLYKGWDIQVDAQSNIYVCNMIYSEDGDTLLRDSVKVFNTQTWQVHEVGKQSYENGNSDAGYLPYGLDLDSQGRLYVADLGTNTVRIFDSSGQLLGQFFGEYGEGPDEFIDLIDLAVDESRGWLYIIDSINSRVKQYRLTFTKDGTPQLQLERTFGDYGPKLGQFAYPQTLAVDPQTGMLYVGDMANLRIQAFDSQGQALYQFSPPNVSNWQIMGMDISSEGILYAVDALNNVVWAFERDGKFVGQIGAQQVGAQP